MPGGGCRGPDWSADGTQIAVSCCNESQVAITLVQRSDPGVWQTVTDPPSGYDIQPSWMPDGQRIAFTSTRSGSFDLWMIDLTTVGAPPDASPGRPGLMVAPNPADGWVTIRFAASALEAGRVDIHDVAGRLVRRMTLDGAARGTITWDRQDSGGRRIAAGTYLVRLTTDDGHTTRRVVVR